MQDEVKSANINGLWLQNIYENLKKLEENMRLAREGCNSVLEYLQLYNIPRSSLNDIRYKNLRLIITELSLLVTDLLPVIKKSDEYYESIKQLDQLIDNKNLFIKETSNLDGELKSSIVTPFFKATLDQADNIRRKIIIDIGNILYMDNAPSVQAQREVRRI
jgi:hypothetical protein